MDDRWRSGLGIVSAGVVAGLLLGYCTIGDSFEFYKAGRGHRLAVVVDSAAVDFGSLEASRAREAYLEKQKRACDQCGQAPRTSALRPAAYSYYYDELPVKSKAREAWDDEEHAEVILPAVVQDEEPYPDDRLESDRDYDADDHQPPASYEG